jgi:hypothetical protein
MNDREETGQGTGTRLSDLPPPTGVPSASQRPPPGWYPEPGGGRQRYWYGSTWGEYAPQANSTVQRTEAPDGKGIQIAGYICAGFAALMPLLGLAGLILGILTATKRGRGGHGAAIIILSIVIAGISYVVWYNAILHHAAAQTGSCYYDTSGNHICP